MKQPKIPHPAWALQNRQPRTELRLINGKYYLYGYKTVYDKESKRPKKISGNLMGSITEKDGFVPSKKRDLEKNLSQKVFSKVLCKEFGVSNLVMTQFKPYCDALQLAFPQDWKYVLAIAYCRFIYRCPLKAMPFRLASSYLPDIIGLVPFNEKGVSAVLNRLGAMPDQMLGYMKSFIGKGEYMLMDATHIFSHSHQINLARKGYNSSFQFDPQFNLMYIYSASSQMPVYYRLLPGNIREVKAFKNTLLEAGLKEAVIIADKGFYSELNVSLLLEEKMQFILPLKRNSPIVDYSAIANNTFKEGISYFEHEKRPIWYKVFDIDEQTRVYLFLDEPLRLKEETDCLARIQTNKESYSIEKYHERKHRFGTIALFSNIIDTAQQVYQAYKSRNCIEVLFDGMKNILDSDHTYMQNEQTLQGWMFINHLTLQWYQHLYIQLKNKHLIKKISVNDYIQTLTDVKKIRINDQWHFNEFTAQTQKLMAKLGIKLT
jgi:transposase